MTLSIRGLFVKLSISDSELKWHSGLQGSYIMLSVIMSRSRFIYLYAECHYDECRFDESHYAECHYAECRYAEHHRASTN